MRTSFQLIEPDLASRLALCVAFGVAGCNSTGSGVEPIECLLDANCPPACECEGADFDLVGRCENPNSGKRCGGTCDTGTACAEGTECLLSSTSDSLELYACRAPGGTGGSAGSGGTGGSGGMGGSAGIVARCMESTMVYCNNGYDCREMGWTVSAQVFEDLYQQSLQDCLNSGTPCTTEEAYCSDRGFAGTYNAANHEACISGQRTTNCAVDESDFPVYPPECDQICQ